MAHEDREQSLASCSIPSTQPVGKASQGASTDLGARRPGEDPQGPVAKDTGRRTREDPGTFTYGCNQSTIFKEKTGEVGW